MQLYEQLEQEYAEFDGSKYAVSCSSGTAALHLALLALGIGEGDEVVVPDFTMAAVPFSVSYTRATPVFADVDLKSYGMDPEDLLKRINKRTKAIIVVHTYGRLADIEAILKIAHKHNLPVIEDACEAQGAIYESKANITVYSFYRNKIIPGEEGGMLTMNKKKVADRVRYLKNMTFSPEHDFMHKEIGYNYRMPNQMAALALRSLWRYHTINENRRIIEIVYENNLAIKMPRHDAVWFYEVPVVEKKRVLQSCKDARDSFKPCSSFPMYGSRKGRPNARALSDVLVLLPVRLDMTGGEIKKICKKISWKN